MIVANFGIDRPVDTTPVVPSARIAAVEMRHDPRHDSASSGTDVPAMTPGTSTARPLCNALQRLIEAWNISDWAGVARLYRHDIVWLTPIGRFDGRDAVLSRHRHDAGQHPEAFSQIITLAEDPPTAFMETESRRRDTGEPTGAPIMVTVATFVDEQISVLRSYWHPE
jgi:ketosteroid isomerase-like protein